MNFLDLPVDVGIVIFNYLDLTSKLNVYNSSYALRNFFAPCHLKKVVLSRNTLATVKILKEVIFQDLGQHIEDLNFNGVSDLSAETLKPYMNRFVHLKILDVAFTKIYLSDLEEICPDGLKNLSINFFKSPRKCKKDGTWEKIKNIFRKKEFQSVHFIVFGYEYSDTPLLFLEGLPLTNDLKVTVAENFIFVWDLRDVRLRSDHDIQIAFSKLSFVFRDCAAGKISMLRGVYNLDFKKLEYIFIMYQRKKKKIIIYVSPAFKTMFLVNCSDLIVEISPYLPLDFKLVGNIIFKAWNKETTIFDDMFFKNVQNEFKDFFPTYICMHSKIKMSVTNSPSDWYCIDACDGFEQSLEYLPKKVTLTDFCRKDGAVIRSNHPVTLSTTSETLKNISFLRLSNICIKEDFFTILFGECPQLDTLDLDVFQHQNQLALSRSIHLTKSLKNIKLTSLVIEYEKVFETLNQCLTLENIHICEYMIREIDDVNVDVNNIVVLIERCENLYSLFIRANMPSESMTLMMSPLREAAQKCKRDRLCIEVGGSCDGWNPFVDVFNPSPLHILD